MMFFPHQATHADQPLLLYPSFSFALWRWRGGAADDAPILRHVFDLKETKRSFGRFNCTRSRDVFSIVSSRLSPDLTSDFQSELKRKAKGQVKVTGGYRGKSPQVTGGEGCWVR